MMRITSMLIAVTLAAMYLGGCGAPNDPRQTSSHEQRTQSGVGDSQTAEATDHSNNRQAANAEAPESTNNHQKQTTVAKAEISEAELARRVADIAHVIGSREYKLRKQALDELVELGPAAIEPLFDAMMESEFKAIADLEAAGEFDDAKVVFYLTAIQGVGEAVKKMGPPAAPELSRLLKHDDPMRRHMALAAISIAGIATDEGVTEIAKALDAESPHVRSLAALALGRLRRTSDDIIDSLIVALKDEDAEVRSNAIHALRGLGTNADRPLSALVRAVKTHDDAQVRTVAALALGKHGEPIVPELIEMLEHEDALVVDTAVRVLGEIGPDAKAALPALPRAFALKHPRMLKYEPVSNFPFGELINFFGVLQRVLHARTGEAAIWATYEIGGQDALPFLLDGLSHKDSYARSRCAAALGQLEADDRAVMALAETLSDEDLDVRSHALESLTKYGPQAKSVIYDLIKLRDDKNAGMRQRAADALARVNPRDKAVISALIKLLSDESKDVRSSAARALAAAGPAAEDAVPALTSMLRDEDSEALIRAIETLGAIGSAARSALTELERISRRSKNSSIRFQAKNAIRKISKVP